MIRRIFFSAFVTLVLALPAPSTFGQQRRNRARAKRTAVVDAAAAQKRRAQGIALLDETAKAARSFELPEDRATIQTLAADAMWKFDPERAGVVFRRAWEAATEADRLEAEEAAREAVASVNTGAQVFTGSRDEVLAKAATRDTTLAEVFLKELAQEKERAESSPNSTSQTHTRTTWGQLSAGGARRLALALDLLRRRDYDHATQIAATLAGEEASADLISFLIVLRSFKPHEADTIYFRLLKSAAGDTSSDANTVLRLSSLFVSPELLISIDERGSLQFRPILYDTYNPDDSKSAEASRAPLPQALRDAFYNFAANVILRPTASSGSNQAAETTALFYTTNRLLPFFERDAASFAPAVRARSGVLASEIEASRRDALDRETNLRSLTTERGIDPLRPQTNQLTHARNEAERRSASLSIIRAAARNRLWDRARRAAEELNDVEVRRAALSFIAIAQVADISRAFADDDEETKAAQFVANADLPPFARAWGFAEASQIAARKATGAQRATQLFDMAVSEAARVDMGTRERIAAYTVVAKVALRLNEWARVWGLIPEIVKASNAVEDYNGDEDSLSITVDRNQSTETANFSIESEDFRTDAIFNLLARKDFDRALMQANALQGELPRALARIAVARAAFEPAL